MIGANFENFIGFVDQRVNANPKFTDLFTFETVRLPSLVTLAAKKCVNHYYDLSSYPDDIQQQVLFSSKNFTYWKDVRCLCEDKVVDGNDAAIQARIGKSSKTPEVDIFKHLFNETFLGCDPAVRDTLIQFKRKAEPLAALSSNRLNECIEKIISVAVTILSNPTFQTVACLLLAYHTYGLAWKILGFADSYILAKALPLLATHLPATVVAVAAKTFELRGFIWLGLFGLSKLFPASALKKWVFTPLMEGIIYTIPIGLSIKIITLSIKSYRLYSSQAPVLGVKLATLNAAWIDLRLGKEVVQARRLWVQENLDYRDRLRKEAFKALAAGAA